MSRNGTADFGASESGLDRRSPANAEARHLLASSGFLLVAIGILHLCVWVSSGEPWEGSSSWRKPSLFGVSGGLTLVSMSLLLGLLYPWAIDGWLSRILGCAMVLEVGVISLQQWRGAESHFNRSTTIDGMIDTSITIFITAVTFCILVLAIRAFTSLRARADQQIAWRGGLVFLLLSCAIGFVIFIYGVSQTTAGADPTKFGTGGVVKFPHGMSIHAIQLLPCLCWLLARLHVPLAARVNSLRFMNMSVACLLGCSILQTLAGRAREDFTLLSGCVLIVALIFTFPLLVAIAKAVASKMKSRILVISRGTR